jgi:hypothetical protein
MFAVIMTGESVGNINATTLASHAKHALKHRIEIISHYMSAIHEGQFDSSVSTQQMSYDIRLLGELIEGR